MIDLTQGKYYRPTSVPEFQKMRLNHLDCFGRLVDKLTASSAQRSIDDDNSENFTAPPTIGSKRSLDDFLCDEAEENKSTKRIVGRIIEEIQEYGTALKH